MPRASPGTTLAEPIEIEAFGVNVGVDVRVPELRGPVEGLLPPGWRPGTGKPVARFLVEPAGDGIYQLKKDGRSVGGPLDAAVVVRLLDSRIRLEIAGGVQDWTFVHAGVVAVGGRAMLLPGRSFAGKTTLVAALIRAGATYLSDEYAVLDDDGLVHPYPRPLSLGPLGARRGATQVPTDEASAASLGAQSSETALPAALIASLTYCAGADWAPVSRSRAEGALALMTHAATARVQPAKVLARIRAVASAATVIEGERGEAAATAEALLGMLADQP